MTTGFALSFDLDYTLWDLDTVIERAEARLHDYLRAHYPRVAERHSVEDLRRLRAEVVADDPGISHDLTEQRLRALRRAAEAVGAPASMAEEGLAVFLAARNKVRVYRDTEPVLRRLHRQHPLLALTNGNADVHRIGLGHYFRHTISAIDAGAAKPAPPIFREACERARLPPQRIVHVGDDPETDVRGAAAFGMRAVWLNRSGIPWPAHLEPAPHVEIRDLHQLLPLVHRE